MSKIQNFEVPSAVLHIRSIPAGTTENDLFQITFDQSHKFGKCVSVRLLERYHQALLEMDSIDSATRLLKYSQKNSLLLHGKPVQISYSKSQTINQSNSSSPIHSPVNSSSPSSSYHPRVSSPTYTTTSSSSQQNVFPSSPSTRNHSFPSSPSNNNNNTTTNKTSNGSSNTPPIPGSVLLCTIESQANHSITIDHLYHAFSSCGEVLRIVMFTKNNLQALIEFSSVDNALNAKKTLFGHALFHGGQCKLKLEISKTDRLNITQNTDRAKDYTKSSTPSSQSPSSSSTTSSSSSTPHHQQTHHHQTPSYYQSHRSNDHHHQSHHGGNNHYSQRGNNSNDHHHHHAPTSYHQQTSHHHHNPHNRTTVLIVHGLDENIMTIDRIFNLFSVYGNVQRVKILSTKKGAALVQMEDPQQAELIIRFYHQMPLFKDTLQITYSKHLSITDSHNPESPSLSKNFSDSSLHRFSHPINTYKHLYKPSQTLYFSNVPKDFTEASFIQLLQSHNLPKPIGFKIFSTQLLGGSGSPTTTTTSTTTATSSNTTASVSQPPVANGTNAAQPSSSTSSSTPENKNTDKIVGLLEFQTQTQAVEALVLLNNLVLPNSNYSLRLSFSNSTVLPHPPKVNSNPNTPNNNTPNNNINNSPSTQSPQPQQSSQQSQASPQTKHF
ncbi:hypothetical protein DICPUDRAFT_55687 [Dictyostelium purpureum]|uniref:RRM domain-containing protein n=1 Tax=Dictyostelium purpureum TaxID=5786 RepID=F0ZN83_DICPU|nr:uncharacterized protein DICPUDRAFT_55687 [Dictyostelium purpureum]EGC34595.1 hypothetical protein DICPUDRAFT_55687 [Dictyostelium purpureum]|eukprot:XP_003288872.1 hypothetical protein DICPUDRAFT_55687 [Dictyostelium purpureum]